jgi:predicted transcriptional regulator
MAMTLRLSEEQDKRLTLVAESLGISKNKAAMDAIEAFIELEWQKALAKSVVAEVLVRDKELFDRLADA